MRCFGKIHFKISLKTERTAYVKLPFEHSAQGDRIGVLSKNILAIGLKCPLLKALHDDRIRNLINKR